MQLILASRSPRRQELMHLLTNDFAVCPADVDESMPQGLSSVQYPVFLAEKKAYAVLTRFPDARVLGADTIVLCDGEIYGKPHDDADAARMLRALSGKTHQVITGVALLEGARADTFSVETLVTFYPLDEAEILSYVATGEPLDKAGAYGIQGAGAKLVKGINGDFYNVVGLPVGELFRHMRAFWNRAESW